MLHLVILVTLVAENGMRINTPVLKKECSFDFSSSFHGDACIVNDFISSDEDNGNERYIVYDNDESTGFNNALEIYKNTQYNNLYFNDHSDDDYFFCTMNAGEIASVYCNKSFDLQIFRFSGSNIVQRFDTVYSTSTKIVFDDNEKFGFKITGPSNYTGRYSFSINTYSESGYVNNSSYVRLKFSSTKMISSTLLTFNDMDSLPSSGYKEGYLGSNNNSPFTIDYNGYMSLTSYGNTVNGTQYPLNFRISSGIYNNNNVLTGNSSDDDRNVFNYDTYVANSSPYLSSSFVYSDTYNIRASSFFVDNNYAFSATHTIYPGGGKGFPTNISLIIGKHPNNGTIYEIPCVEVIFPYAYIYYKINSYPNDIRRIYDWCILKVNTSNLPSAYVHSYLGLEYPCNSNLSYYCFGYPCYSYVGSNNYIEQNDPHCTYYRLLAGTSGSVYYHNYLLKSFMDLNNGQSGGPCIYKNNTNIGIAVGVVSGGDNNNGNVFAPINQYNFNLLSKYLSGVI